MEKLMRNLQKIREDRRVSYMTLARATGIPAEKLREIEEGTQQPSIAELDRLLAFYKINSQQLLRYKGKRQTLFRYGIIATLLLVVVAAVLFVLGWNVLRSNESTAEPARQERSSESAETGSGALQSSGEQGPQLRETVTSDDSSQSGSDHSLGDGEHDTSEAPPTSSNDQVGDHSPVNTVAGKATDTHIDEAGIMHEAAEKQGGIDIAHKELANEGAERLSEEDGTVLRFWGNIPYSAGQLPELVGNGAHDVRHIIPVTRLDEERPKWLAAAPDRYVLNLATADIWTSTTLNEWRNLQQDGIPFIGLGEQPSVYEPFVIEAEGMKIGILSLAGLIHEANQIAYPNRVGLPRAYDNLEVKKAVEEAKSQVDFLFVLIHWGERRGGEEPIAKQERLARVIAQSGGDVIIGNRSIRAQRMQNVNGVPVFFSLGRSVSEHANDGQINMVLDVYFSHNRAETAPYKVVLRAGIMHDGVLQFAPLGEEVTHQLHDTLAEAWQDESMELAVNGG